MSTSRHHRAKGDLANLYQKVTARIIERLEEGVVPWESPHAATIGFPRNFQSGNSYRGINVMLLAMEGYSSPWFLTYKQARDRGGQVRKGEKGSAIVKVGTYEKERTDGINEKRKYLKLYTVFNACQIDGIDFPVSNLPPATDDGRTDAAKRIVADMPDPPVIHEGRSALTCYDPQTDCIDIPHREHFSSVRRFYKSLFHEMVHSTGAAKRLARKSLIENKGMKMSDRTIYSKEELVAEIGAAFLCAHAGIVIDDHENSAAYLAGWLTVLKQSANERWIVEAAGHAQKAADHVLGFEP